jgi:predicted enzyme related to lactoylglutathione lyase
MSTQTKLDFVVFYVSNLEESITYFTQQLGFKSVPEQSGSVFHYLTSGDGGIDFGLNLVSAETPPAGTAQIYFKTKDLEALHNDLASKDIATTGIMELPFGNIFTAQTPDGLKVVMMN